MVPALKPRSATRRPTLGDRASSRGVLPTSVDEGILRGVPLHLCLAGWGRHWKTSNSAAPVTATTLSQEASSLAEFISHDWGTARWKKFVTMLVMYNSRAAFFTTAAVSLIESIVVLVMGWRRQAWTTCLGFLTFPFILCFWQRIRVLIAPPTLVFMDKLCIAQDDPDLKMQGIMGIAAFMERTRKLTILWSPRYFTRLWCTYELGSFFRDGSRDAPDSIEIMPVALGVIVFLMGILAHSFTIVWLIFGSAYANDLSAAPSNALVWRATTVLPAAFILAPIAFVFLSLQSYVGLRLMRDIAQLPQQLKTFSIRDSSCGCCTHHHCVPATGDYIPCDRVAVYATLQSWYPNGSGSEEALLNRFDHTVRSKLSRIVAKQLGTGHLPVPYLLYMVCSTSVAGFPYYIQDVARIPADVDAIYVWEYLLWLFFDSTRLSVLFIFVVTISLWLWKVLQKTGSGLAGTVCLSLLLGFSGMLFSGAFMVGLEYAYWDTRVDVAGSAIYFSVLAITVISLWTQRRHQKTWEPADFTSQTSTLQ